MKLFEIYPEIENFFKKKSFTVEEVNELINLLKTKYDNQTLIKAKSILELGLLGYNLKKFENKENRNKCSKNTEKVKKKKKQKNGANVLENKMTGDLDVVKKIKRNTNPNDLNNNCAISLLEIAKELQWDLSKVKYIVDSKTNRSNDTTISYSDYELCKEAFLSRKIALEKQRRKKSQNSIRIIPSSKNFRIKTSSGVWDEISKYGLKKLIYIRSR